MATRLSDIIAISIDGVELTSLYGDVHLPFDHPSCRCAPPIDYGDAESFPVNTEKEAPYEVEGKPRVVEGVLEDRCPVCKIYLEAGYMHASCAAQVGYEENSAKALPAPSSNEQIWE